MLYGENIYPPLTRLYYIGISVFNLFAAVVVVVQIQIWAHIILSYTASLLRK